MSTLIRCHIIPDQMPHYMASDLGLHFLTMTLLRLGKIYSSLLVQKIKENETNAKHAVCRILHMHDKKGRVWPDKNAFDNQ